LAAAVLRDIASRQPSMEECYRRIQLVKATKHFVVKCVLSDQREIATLMNVHVVAALTTTMRKRRQEWTRVRIDVDARKTRCPPTAAPRYILEVTAA